jgi:WD40 repeat protein
MRLGETRFRPGVRISHLAFSPDGGQLASWGNWLYFEDRLSVWDVATGKERQTYSVGERLIADLCWGPDGRAFAAITAGDRFRVWSFLDPKDTPPKSKPGPAQGRAVAGAVTASERLALSSDGRRLAAIRDGTPATPGSVRLFDAKECVANESPKPVAQRDDLGRGKCSSLRFIRRGRALVVLTESETKGEQSVVVWDTENDSVTERVNVPIGVRQGNRQSYDVTEDGSAFAVGLADGTVNIYELPSGRQRLSVKKHDGPKNGARWSEVSAVKFVNGDRNVLSAGRDSRQLVWDATTGVDVAVLNGHDSWVEAVAVSPDGKRVATAGQDSLVRLWDVATWQSLTPPQGPRHTVWRLEVARDGQYVATASSYGAHVWKFATGREVRMVPCDNASGFVLFAPGEGVVAGTTGNLALYPLPSGEPKRLAAKGRLLDFTPDGKTLLTAQGNTVYVWDWPDCRQRRAVSVKGEPTSAAVSPDGKVAVIGPGTSVVDLEFGAVGETSLKLHWFSRAAGFSTDGRVVCGTVGSAGSARAESWIVIARSPGQQFEQPPQQGLGHFYQLCFAVSADGRRAASGQSDGGVTVFEMASGQVLAHFQGHREAIIGIAWTPDGKRVLSAGGDHQVLVWDTSLPALAGKVDALSSAERRAAWDRLGSQSAKEALRTMAALAADADGAVTFLAGELKPVFPVPAETLDRIFRDLDAEGFQIRAQARRELSGLGSGAIAGVRQRLAAANSVEVKERAAEFLARFESAATTPEGLRILRGLEVLAAINTPAARRLLEGLAGGAASIWETDAAAQTLRSLPSATGN